MLSLRFLGTCARVQICTRAGDQSVLLKYQISGLGVTRAFRERRKKLAREKERKAVGCCSTRKLCARKGEERERARGFNHEEVQRELVSKLTRYEYTSSSSVKESGVVVVFFFKEERKRRNCASPSDDNLFYDWGFVFFFASSSSSCAKRCFVPVFSRSRANSANDDDSPF